MQGRRTDRIEEQLRIEIGEIVGIEIQDPRVRLVTVTAVKASPDLSHARVFVSVIGGDEERRKALQGLRSATGFVKRALGKRLHHMRRIPDLTFDYDEFLAKEARIEELFNAIGETGGDGETEASGSEPEK